jgi:hypothetical protein
MVSSRTGSFRRTSHGLQPQGRTRGRPRQPRREGDAARALRGGRALLQRWGLVSAAELEAGLRWARSASEDEIRSVRASWSSAGDGLMGRAYFEYVRYAQNALKARGATFD